MKALLCVESGGPEKLVLSEIPPPVAGAGQLAIRVLACGINFPDVLIIRDAYQLKPEKPFAPGCEISGEVIGIGADVSGWRVGDRMVAAISYGGLAEQVIVDAVQAFPLPSKCSALAGAGLLITYGTALYALTVRGELGAGETLLVLGGAGGVGLAAIEVGKALGAHVVAAVSTEEKGREARAAGADDVLVYDRAPLDKPESKALAAAFKDIVGEKGADVVLDPVGGGYAEPALRAIARGGRYLVVGFAAGVPDLPLNLPLLKSCDVRGVLYGPFARREPAANALLVQRLMQWWKVGMIAPRIDSVHTLADAGKAIAALAGRSVIGKAIVRVAGDAP